MSMLKPHSSPFFVANLWNQDNHPIENFLMFRPAFGKRCDVDPRNYRMQPGWVGMLPSRTHARNLDGRCVAAF